MFPRFSLHGMPEPHPEGLPHGPSGTSLTSEPHGQGSHGGIAPSSLTQADFGRATGPAGAGRNALLPPRHSHDPYRPVTFQGMQGSYYILGGDNPNWVSAGDAHVVYQRDPVTHGYTPTYLTARHGADGWVLNNPPPVQATSSHAQPASSSVSSAQASAEAATVRPLVLEDLVKEAHIYGWKTTIGFRDTNKWRVHIFKNGEHFPEGGEQDFRVANKILDNREYAAEQVAKVLDAHGYQVTRPSQGPKRMRLMATNRQTGAGFWVIVTLSGKQAVVTPENVPRGVPYFIGVVDINRENGWLRALHLIPVMRDEHSIA